MFGFGKSDEEKAKELLNRAQSRKIDENQDPGMALDFTTSDNPAVRVPASRALPAICDRYPDRILPGIQRIWPLLDDPHPEVTGNGLLALTKLANDNPDAVQAQIERVREKLHSKNHLQALHCLVQVAEDDPSVIIPVLEYFEEMLSEFEEKSELMEAELVLKGLAHLSKQDSEVAKRIYPDVYKAISTVRGFDVDRVGTGNFDDPSQLEGTSFNRLALDYIAHLTKEDPEFVVRSSWSVSVITSFLKRGFKSTVGSSSQRLYEDVRRKSLITISRLPEECPELISDLLEMLQHHIDFSDYDEVKYYLMTISSFATNTDYIDEVPIDDAVSYFDSEYPIIQTNAAKVAHFYAGRYPEELTDHLDQIRKWLDSEERPVRVYGVATLSWIGMEFPEKVRPMVGQIRTLVQEDPDEMVSQQAAVAIGAVAGFDPEVLIPEVHDDTYHHLCNAVEDSKPYPAFEWFTNQLNHEDVEVAQSSFSALSRILNDEKPLFEEHVQRMDEGEVSVIADELDKLSSVIADKLDLDKLDVPTSVPENSLIDQEKDSVPKIRSTKHIDDGVIDGLNTHLEAEDRELRVVGFRLAARISEDTPARLAQIVGELASGLNDDELTIRVNAVQAIVAISEVSPRVLEPETEALCSVLDDKLIRRPIVLALDNIREKTDATLVDSVPEIQHLLAGDLNTHEALEILERAAMEDSSKVVPVLELLVDEYLNKTETPSILLEVAKHSSESVEPFVPEMLSALKARRGGRPEHSSTYRQTMTQALLQLEDEAILSRLDNIDDPDQEVNRLIEESLRDSDLDSI